MAQSDWKCLLRACCWTHSLVSTAAQIDRFPGHCAPSSRAQLVSFDAFRSIFTTCGRAKAGCRSRDAPPIPSICAYLAFLYRVSSIRDSGHCRWKERRSHHANVDRSLLILILALSLYSSSGWAISAVAIRASAWQTIELTVASMKLETGCGVGLRGCSLLRLRKKHHSNCLPQRYIQAAALVPRGRMKPSHWGHI
ncbi:hypothetical protein BC628DRAFT_544356 [Trametes gibbosa]|nr:hypothetical protein BC628DRAFT_544356 [Trametes gibbosa]